MTVDLRSDTVTRPTPEMLQAMMRAKTGDDVFGEDPSVNELEAITAAMFGMEEALYCPTGTMSNQTAIRCHTQPGDEVICDKMAHVYMYEGGGIAANSGSQVRAIQGDHGRITARQVAECINPDDVHKARTSLVCLENTSNRGGGSRYDIGEIKKIRTLCDLNHLKLHLDGARLFNAMVAGNESPRQYGELFHTISICLNKGLGCPIGSVLLGPAAFIKRARRVRKVFGGGMRQAGFMAAAGIYALSHHVSRLAEDHWHAGLLAAAWAKKSFVEDILPVETNIVIFRLDPSYPAPELAARLRQGGVLAIAISTQEMRMVTHLDVNPAGVEHVIKVIDSL
ncbi:MAG: GntG family PLP-dependent aldolase [Puia sp.]|nr:GntG family PLP-dependent aldolase [Puia sp.]